MFIDHSSFLVTNRSVHELSFSWLICNQVGATTTTSLTNLPCSVKMAADTQVSMAIIFISRKSWDNSIWQAYMIAWYKAQIHVNQIKQNIYMAYVLTFLTPVVRIGVFSLVWLCGPYWKVKSCDFVWDCSHQVNAVWWLSSTDDDWHAIFPTLAIPIMTAISWEWGEELSIRLISQERRNLFTLTICLSRINGICCLVQWFTHSIESDYLSSLMTFSVTMGQLCNNKSPAIHWH